ncbi:hypothetical protein CBS14141_003565 [Malassezia furfur]|nr:hypothetical protein CBS14141_003565 [Malassezia furfur]
MHLTRFLVLSALFALSAIVYAANWDKDDIEHALEKMEGAGANFYSIMGLKPSATLAQIRKAYREKSLDPDKNSGVPNAYKRFEQLGLIHKILRDERRDRYDHFLSHGFPKWRSTGYYYERYRPGLPLVLFLLVAFSVGMQLLVQKINWRKDKERIENLRRSAYALAWGAWFQTPSDSTKGIKPKARPHEKKVRVPLSGFPDFPKAPTESAIKAGTVDWNEEGEKVRKAVTSAPLNFSEDNHLLDVMVYADGSMAASNPATQEWFAIEPLEDKNAPSLLTTWPVTMIKSFLAKRDTELTEPQDVPAEEVVEESSSTKKTPTRRRKRATKAN